MPLSPKKKKIVRKKQPVNYSAELDRIKKQLDQTSPIFACLVTRGLISLDKNYVSHKEFWALANRYCKKTERHAKDVPDGRLLRRRSWTGQSMPAASGALGAFAASSRWKSCHSINRLPRLLPVTSPPVRGHRSENMTTRYSRRLRRLIDYNHVLIDQILQGCGEVDEPLLAMLSLQGLADVSALDILYQEMECFQNILRTWRNESPLTDAYQTNKETRAMLRRLTVFKHLHVPLFIDNYGDWRTLASYSETLRDLSSESDPAMTPIAVHGDTEICHVTHWAQAEKIAKLKAFIPNDNKNSLRGTWFGENTAASVYGPSKFVTTLSKLGITGLRQGEVVSYKNETNVILYVDNSVVGFDGLQQPNQKLVRMLDGNPKAYVHWSIFVPGGHMKRQTFSHAFGDGSLCRIKHNYFMCMLKMRFKCPDNPAG